MEGEEALCTLGSSSTLPPGAFLRADDSASLPGAGFANFRLQQNSNVFRFGVYHKPTAVTWMRPSAAMTPWWVDECGISLLLWPPGRHSLSLASLAKTA